MLNMATGKPAHLGCKFLSDVSVVNSPIVVELFLVLVSQFRLLGVDEFNICGSEHHAL